MIVALLHLEPQASSYHHQYQMVQTLYRVAQKSSRTVRFFSVFTATVGECVNFGSLWLHYTSPGRGEADLGVFYGF